jgi:hypothetical protein
MLRSRLASKVLAWALLCPAGLFGQSRLALLKAAPQRRVMPRIVHPKAPQPEPCWKVAGISPEVMARRRSIEQETRERVRQICADSSTSDQQKHQEIREVRKTAAQEIQGLTTPEQREAVKQCTQERAEQHAAAHPVARAPHPSAPNAHPGPSGPCSGIG